MKATAPRKAFGASLTAVTLFFAGLSSAAPPSAVTMQGRLLGKAGQSVDGEYDLVFGIYSGETAKSPIWEEALYGVSVAGGVFNVVLGQKQPLVPALVSGQPELWLQVKVDDDPALSRTRLWSSLMAVVAADVSCSGCVTAEETAFMPKCDDGQVLAVISGKWGCGEPVMGPQGPPGADGAAGADGPKGDTGPAGPTGGAGPQGPKGDPGPTGPQGLTGPKGDTGVQGPKGDTGAQGPQGATGVQGAKGDTGPKGAKGDTGAQGPTGAIGPQGPKGDTGPKGPMGDPAIGSVYVSWGSTGCASGWAKAYGGYITGVGNSDDGGRSPAGPICTSVLVSEDANSSFSAVAVQGLYNEHSNETSRKSCAVCVKGKTQCYTRWGAADCISGFTKVYSGYLTALGSPDDSAREFSQPFCGNFTVSGDPNGGYGMSLAQAKWNQNQAKAGRTTCAVCCP